jgi:predicted  nucleic acid-binding Zn-ribbon protein
MDGPALVALQEIDLTLDQLGHRRRRLPELTARAAANSTVRTLTDERDAARAVAAQAEADVAAAEQAAVELATKRARLDGQLKTIISPREAEALMHEIATLDARRDELDDRELDALGRMEEAEGAAALAERELPAAQEALAEAQVALDAAVAALDDEVAGWRVAREAAAAVLSAADLATYERARSQFDGVAIAHLEGNHCSGCHLDLARADLDALRALPPGEVGECPQCMRFLTVR